MHEWMDGWMDRCMNGSMGGCVDKWVDGWDKWAGYMVFIFIIIVQIIFNEGIGNHK